MAESGIGFGDIVFAVFIGLGIAAGLAIWTTYREGKGMDE